MTDIKNEVELATQGDCDHIENAPKPVPTQINQKNAEMYHEAIARYPNDDAIDAEEERKVIRKLDRRILPVLGICYFFYVRIDTQYIFTVARTGGQNGRTLLTDQRPVR